MNDTTDSEIIVDCTPTFMCLTFGDNNAFFERDIMKLVSPCVTQYDIVHYIQNGYFPENFDFPAPCNGKMTIGQNESTYCIESGYLLDGTCGLMMEQVSYSLNFVLILIS